MTAFFGATDRSEYVFDAFSFRHIGAYIEEHPSFSAAGINQGLRTLRRALRLAYEWRKLERRPTVQLAAGENRRMRVLTPEEEKKYLDHAPEPWRTMAIISIELGMRPGEIIALRVEDIAWSDSAIRIPGGKSKAAKRELPMTDAVFRAIKAWREKSGISSGWLFPSRVKKDRPYSQKMIFDWHHAALRASGVKAFEPYCLRHTALTRLAQHCNPFTVAAAAGHSSISITQRYVHPQKADVWQAFEEKSGLKIGHAQRKDQLKVVGGKDEDGCKS